MVERLTWKKLAWSLAFFYLPWLINRLVFWLYGVAIICSNRTAINVAIA